MKKEKNIIVKSLLLFALAAACVFCIMLLSPFIYKLLAAIVLFVALASIK